MRSALFLALAIVCEIFGTTMLKMSNGFTILIPSILVVIGFLSAFAFLGLALKGIALSTAYAIWSGVGTALTATIGMLVFGESMSALKMIALTLIVVGVVVLNKSGDAEEVSIEPPHPIEPIKTIESVKI